MKKKVGQIYNKVIVEGGGSNESRKNTLMPYEIDVKDLNVDSEGNVKKLPTIVEIPEENLVGILVLQPDGSSVIGGSVVTQELDVIDGKIVLPASSMVGMVSRAFILGLKGTLPEGLIYNDKSVSSVPASYQQLCTELGNSIDVFQIPELEGIKFGDNPSDITSWKYSDGSPVLPFGYRGIRLIPPIFGLTMGTNISRIPVYNRNPRAIISPISIVTQAIEMKP